MKPDFQVFSRILSLGRTLASHGSTSSSLVFGFLRVDLSMVTDCVALIVRRWCRHDLNPSSM